MKIFLSPSNQDANVYAWGNTTESVQCGRIALELQKRLEARGFETLLMHDADMASKVAAADAWGADLYIPIHTNAYNGSVLGTRLFFGQSGGEGERLCNCIFAHLAPITPGESESCRIYPELYEIGKPKAWTAYIEVEFHDSEVGAKWITEHTEDIAEAICLGICDYAGTAPKPERHQTIYRVQVGAFAQRENAERMKEKLKEAGYPGFLVEDRL